MRFPTEIIPAAINKFSKYEMAMLLLFLDLIARHNGNLPDISLRDFARALKTQAEPAYNFAVKLPQVCGEFAASLPQVCRKFEVELKEIQGLNSKADCGEIEGKENESPPTTPKAKEMPVSKTLINTSIKNPKDKLILLHTGEPEKSETPALEKIPYEQVKGAWNEILVPRGLPQLKTLSKDRKDRIKMRWGALGNLEGVKRYFKFVDVDEWLLVKCNDPFSNLFRNDSRIHSVLERAQSPPIEQGGGVGKHETKFEGW